MWLASLWGVGSARYDSLSDKLVCSWKRYKNKKLWATRESSFRYQFHSYDEVYSKAQSFGRYLHSNGLKKGDFVAISAETKVEWLIADLACSLFGFTSVPLDTHTNETTMKHLLDATQPKVVICSTPLKTKFSKYYDHHKVIPSDIVFTVPPSPFAPQDVINISAAEDHNCLFTLQPTSGSTGVPKLLQYTRARWCQLEGGGDTALIFHSLASPAPRTWVWLNLFSGGLVAESSPESLIEDCQFIQPTQVSAPPIVWDSICHLIISGRIQPSPDMEGEFNWTKQLFGNNCKALTNTGAVISPDTLKAMKTFFPRVVHDGYGSGETGGIAVDGNLLSGVEYKLKDVADLGYYSTDLPYPRGELLVRTSTMFDGYFTGNKVDTIPQEKKEEWFSTGDIVQLVGPRKIEVIDRKSFVTKLSNGKFVSCSGIEGVLSSSEMVQQSYVHVDIKESKLIAVIVPSWNALQAEIRGTPPLSSLEGLGLSELVQSEMLNSYLLQMLRRLQQDKGAAPYELIRGLIIEREPFSIANGLLTPSLKLCRPALLNFYASKLSSFSSLSNDPVIVSGDDTIANQTFQVIKEVLGFEVPPLQLWSEVGLDSITAVQLAQRVSAIFKKQVTVTTIFKSGTPHNLVQLLSDTNNTKPTQSDISFEMDILTSDIRSPFTLLPSMPQKNPREDVSVFLTGASGFLGAHLLNELISVPGTKVICLVRGGLDILLKRLLYYGFQYEPDVVRRIQVIQGDLSLPNFGLDDLQFQNLKRDIDIVLHCGANVNWVLPYSALRTCNTLPILPLVALAGSNPIHFVSTIAVAEPGSCENRSPEPHITYGYGASKWAAEALLSRATSQCGTQVVIYRPGHLVKLPNHLDANRPLPRPLPGLNSNDYLSLLIRTCMEIKGVATAASNNPSAEWTCVDTTARAIIKSVMVRYHSKSNKYPSEFNLFTDHQTPYQVLFDALEEEGYPITVISREEWRKRIAKSPLVPLAPILYNGISGSSFTKTHSNTAINYIEKISWPKITSNTAKYWIASLKHKQTLI